MAKLALLSFPLQHSAYRYIATEIDMIHVRRAAEHDSPAFEVIVREGKGETRHHVTMSREMCERLTAGKHTPGALSRGGLPVLARPRAKGIDPQTFRCDGDLALFPRVRAGDAPIPFAALTKTAKSVAPLVLLSPVGPAPRLWLASTRSNYFVFFFSSRRRHTRFAGIDRSCKKR